MINLTHEIENKNYPSPISTADELPPEGKNILWWYPYLSGRGWKTGFLELSMENRDCLHGVLVGDGRKHHWYLWEDLPLGDGETWWMYPPPTPGETE